MRVEADVFNPDESLSPGMYADIIIYAKGNVSGFRVPKSAVVTSTEQKYVLMVKSGRIVKVDVTSGNESGSSAEVFGNLTKGDSVVSVANEEIREGVY